MTEIDMSTEAIERLAETLLFRGHHHQEKINHLLRRLHVERITASKTLRALAAERDRLREAVVEMERSPEYWHGRALKAEASLTEARAETGALIEAVKFARRRLEDAADQMLAGSRDGGIHAGRELKRLLGSVFAEVDGVLSPDATASLAEVRRAERAAGKVDGLREAAEDFEHDSNLSRSICCNGDMCGCRGASAGEYVAHQLRARAAEIEKENGNGH